jgi:hypothetical protein
MYICCQTYTESNKTSFAIFLNAHLKNWRKETYQIVLIQRESTSQRDNVGNVERRVFHGQRCCEPRNVFMNSLLHMLRKMGKSKMKKMIHWLLIEQGLSKSEDWCQCCPSATLGRSSYRAMYLDNASAIPRSCPKWVEWNSLDRPSAINCRRRDNVTRWNIAQIRGTGFRKLLTISFIVVDPLRQMDSRPEQIFPLHNLGPFIHGDEENVLGSRKCYCCYELPWLTFTLLMRNVLL